jgi:hypothetical protein
MLGLFALHAEGVYVMAGGSQLVNTSHALQVTVKSSSGCF